MYRRSFCRGSCQHAHCALYIRWMCASWDEKVTSPRQQLAIDSLPHFSSKIALKEKYRKSRSRSHLWRKLASAIRVMPQEFSLSTQGTFCGKDPCHFSPVCETGEKVTNGQENPFKAKCSEASKSVCVERRLLDHGIMYIYIYMHIS